MQVSTTSTDQPRHTLLVVDDQPLNIKSAAECAGRDALAIILTGMGDDGARGMKLLHERGARTIAQNEESCVVYGMPKEAIAMGGVDDVIALNQVARAILQFDSRG